MRIGLGILFFLFSIGVSAQKVDTSRNSFIDKTSYQFHFQRLFENQIQLYPLNPAFQFKKPSTLLYLNSTDHLPGLFCKMEYKLETKSKLTPRFRLGSLNYTEWMEGKRELYSRYWK